jgi:sucrose phosphorylase
LLDRLADPETPQARVLGAMSDRLRLRSKQPAFHPNATQFTLAVDERVFGVWRQSLDRHQSIFALHNVSEETVVLKSSAINLIEDEDWVDILSGELVDQSVDQLKLAPYQCRWITNHGSA